MHKKSHKLLQIIHTMFHYTTRRELTIVVTISVLLPIEFPNNYLGQPVLQSIYRNSCDKSQN